MIDACGSPLATGGGEWGGLRRILTRCCRACTVVEMIFQRACRGPRTPFSHEMLVINIAPWPSMLTSTSFLGGPEGRGRVGRGWPWGHPLPTLPSARECWRPHCIGLRRPRTSPRRMWPAREPLGNEVINVATNTPVRPGVLVEGGPRATLYRHARDGDPRRRPELCTVWRSPLRD